MQKIINGIQQIGIGVADVKTVFNWYRTHLGFDIMVFNDVATANLMTRYTAGTAEQRQAILALNMSGGGGLEIWQFKNRKPEPPMNPVQFGDLGINAIKIRSSKIKETHKALLNANLTELSEILNENHFYFKDPWGNRVEVVEEHYSFVKDNGNSGGILGVIIGVSDMDASVYFYNKLLGYDTALSDDSGVSDELTNGETHTFRRVLLQRSNQQSGGFGQLYGPSQIELIQALDREPKTIFKGRLWGDLGFIHLCFDVSGLDVLRFEAEEAGHSFTVDSANSFDMGDAAGRFAYMEDPDGTLIELVETHRVPVFKKLGVFINLKKRDPQKPLPKWMVTLMSIHKVKKDI
ncbi:VOC family protein [Zobellia amurskyensis]|uniref:VOC family protein n=1 Tax=Zobellia amurskyensis TaxID=248905 RepID=A0A7X3D1L5_9FLAO|nr:VOC family protein [Zobellia amurskyensis]MUH36121.1 VOC family protein [Zobellia amurskyensis]